jgi:hypothetical protein
LTVDLCGNAPRCRGNILVRQFADFSDMSDPNRPYKSHLFNFVNRQSLRIRDRLGETFRHLRVAAEWSVQLLALPFHWLLRPQQWAGPKLGNGRSQPALSSRMEYLSDPPVDQPLERVLNSLKPWFELPEDSPILDPLDYQPPQIVLSPQYFEQVRQQLAIGTTPDQLLPPAFLPSQPSEVKNLPSHGLGQLVINIKNALSFAKQKDLIIQGIACLLENRQLVLTTADNDLLDVLSGSQQQQLQQRMGLELANYGYERRLQWALSQQQIGFISLIDTETQTAIAPLNFLWRKLQWLEHFTFNLQCGASISTAIVPMPTVPLPSLPLRQPLARLDQTVAQIEAKEIQWGQKVFEQLNQGLVSLRETPILEASIEKISHLQSPLALSQSWQALKSEIIQKLPSSLAPQHSTNLDHPQGQLEATEPDPFQIQALIQAAIAYFFSPASSARPLSAQTSEKLALGQQSGLEETWLSWDDLFSHGDDSVAIPGIKPFAALPGSDDISAVSLESVNTQIQQKPKLTPTPSKASKAATYPVPSDLTVSASPSIISDRITDEPPDSTITHSPAAGLKTPVPKSVPLSKPWEVELEAAFDWIETEAKPVGYSKHLLEYILDWLDVIVVILEENLKKIWRWCYQQYLTFNKAN